jgi:Domain of unknown function (DUF6485)
MASECPNVDGNRQSCNCTYEPCSRKGMCCECVRYHLRMRELPACAFSNEAERSYDRSFSRFCRENRGQT